MDELCDNDKLIDAIINNKITEDIGVNIINVIYYCFKHNKTKFIKSILKNYQSKYIYIFELACIYDITFAIEQTIQYVSNDKIIEHLPRIFENSNLKIFELIFNKTPIVDFIKNNWKSLIEIHTLKPLEWMYTKYPELFPDINELFLFACQFGTQENVKFFHSFGNTFDYDIAIQKAISCGNLNVIIWLCIVDTSLFEKHYDNMKLPSSNFYYYAWFFEKYIIMNQINEPIYSCIYSINNDVLQTLAEKLYNKIINCDKKIYFNVGKRYIENVLEEILKNKFIFVDFSIYFIKELEDNVLFEPMLINEFRDYVFYK